MRKTILVLPDGTEISSGPGTVNAVASCTYTQCVNAGQELTLGSVCANMVELKLITPGGGLEIRAGDALTVFQEEEGLRTQLGIFLAEKPERPTAGTMRITAYDYVTRLDRDLTDWLAARSWPCTLLDLAQAVCTECALELVSTSLPNGSYLVPAFSAQGITGRQMMQWIGQAAGRFCRATAEGKLEFAWYEPVLGHTVGTSPRESGSAEAAWESGVLTLTDETMTAAEENGVLTLTTAALALESVSGGSLELTIQGAGQQHFYFQGSLNWADYDVAPIEKVQIRAGEGDVGVIYPSDAGAVNTYRITGNPLLAGDPAALAPVAQVLYAQLQAVTYTPCTVTIPANSHIRAGHILTLTDRNGRQGQMYVMSRRQAGQRDKLTCTGSHRRDSVSAVHEQSWQALSGKVLNLRTDLEGIRAENKAADGRLASLELTVDGISGQVSRQARESESLRTELTQVAQTASAVQICVQSIREQGVSKVKTEASYTFDDEGLRIARSGEQMENRLDNTGMYVTRAGQLLLQANSDGVAAADVQVENYLCIGANARLEDYGAGRTACFYTGG